MTTPFDTEHFGFQIVPSWHRKFPFPKETCKHCRGIGTIRESDPNSWFDKEVTCISCDGSGEVNKSIKPPEMPKHLIDYLTQNYRDYINRNFGEIGLDGDGI